MTKSEYTVELPAHITLATHCVFNHPKLKNYKFCQAIWLFISYLHSLCSLSSSGRTIVSDEGKGYGRQWMWSGDDEVRSARR